ncbi:MAG: biopolymer transporter ExbD [Bacteroidia bacterium]
MSAKKPKKHPPSIDMTAMVDVAFLLLTFFILTTTRFREDSKVEVDMPGSVSDLPVPDIELCTISVSPDGKVFVGFSDPLTREEVLRRFISEKEATISKDAASYFSTLQEFGVPHREMERWLQGEGDELKEYPHNGIPAMVTDSATMTGNDLKDWIRWGRLADQRMRFAIKGDQDAGYEQISHVISSLQEWNVNQFSLITSLEEGGTVEVE